MVMCPAKSFLPSLNGFLWSLRTLPSLQGLTSHLKWPLRCGLHAQTRSGGSNLWWQQDVGEWIGAGSTGLYNFSPNVRTVPLEM
eukprot:4677938-Amphidinium_carterae.1